MTDTNINKPLLTSEGAAEYLGVTKGWLAKARCTGTPALQFVKIGGSVRYRTEDLDAFINQNLKKSTSQQSAA